MLAENDPAPSTSRTHPPPPVEPPDEPPPRKPTTAPGDRGAQLARLGDRIAELSARIQAATHELLVLIREFDEQEGWDGCLTCAHWLSWRAGLSPGAAREHVRVARALGTLPKLSDAMRRGKVSYSKVRAVTRVATLENEQTLLDVALAGTAAHVERIARAWRRIDRNVEQAEDRRRAANRRLRTWVDEDGMVVVRGRLTPEVGAALRRALEAACDQARRGPAAAGGGEGEAADASAGAEEAARDASSDAEEPTLAQRQADAIGTVAEAAWRADSTGGRPATGIRWCCTSTRRRWRKPRAFPRERPGAQCRNRSRGQAATAFPRERRRPRARGPAVPAANPRYTRKCRGGQDAPVNGDGAARPARVRGHGRRRPPVARPCWTRRGASMSPRKPPGAWPATRPPSPCTTAPAARSSTSAAAPGPSRRPCAGPSRPATGSAGSRVAATPAAMLTT